MSSILASLDMSLDDLIAKKTGGSARPGRGGGRGNTDRDAGGRGSAGPVRGNQQRRANRRRNQPYSRPRDAAMDDDAMDVEDDGGNTKKAAANRRAVLVSKPQRGEKKGSIFARLGKKEDNLGTKLLVKNLKYDIGEDDIRELFGTVGKVTKAEIVYDRSGRSKGMARVWYAKRADAETAIKQYDGRTLDNQPMQISMDADTNVRKGVFGTALASRDDKDVKFKVNLGGNRSQRGRGRGRGGRGGQGRGSKTAEDLDNEMDTYMNDA